MRLDGIRLGPLLAAGLVGLSIVGPVLAEDGNGPVSVQVDKSQGAPQVGLDAQGAPPPVSEAPSLMDVDQTVGPPATDSPSNDWELWLAIGLVGIASAAGSMSFRSKRNWDVAPQVATPPPAKEPSPSTAYETEDASLLTIRNSQVQEYDPAQDFAVAEKTGRFAEFDPGIDPNLTTTHRPTASATTVGQNRPAILSTLLLDDKDPTKGSVRVYADRTWEVIGPDGYPLPIDTTWQHTSSGLEAGTKQFFRGALGGLTTFTAALSLGPVPALFLSIIGGGIADRAGGTLLPVPEAGQTDVTLVRLISCEDAPQYYNPIIQGYVTTRVVRYQTFLFFIRADGTPGLAHDWLDGESVLNPSQDCSLIGGEGR